MEDLKQVQERLQQQAAELQQRQREIEQIQEALAVLLPVWPQLEIAAAITERNRELLPKGLILYGREMPEFPAKQAVYHLPDVDRRTRRKIHNGAMRLVIEAIDFLDESNGTGRSTWNRSIVRSQVAVRQLPREVFNNAIGNAVYANFIEYRDSGKELLKLTDRGIQRAELYKTLPRHQTRVVTSTEDAAEDHAEEQAPPEEVIIPEPAPEDVETEDTEPRVISDADLLKLMPTLRSDLTETLASMGYETDGLRERLRDLREAKVVHKDGPLYVAGPPPVRLKREPVFRKIDPEVPKREDEIDFSVVALSIMLEIGPEQTRDVKPIVKAMARRYNMSAREVEKELAILRGRRCIVDVPMDKIKLSSLGKKLHPAVVAARNQEVISRQPQLR